MGERREIRSGRRTVAPDENGREPVVVGVVTAEGVARDLAESLADALPEQLGERFEGDAEWRAEVSEVPPAEPSASTEELIDAVRRRMLDNGWELGLGLTELPLRIGRRPVTAHASATHGVGLVSVPALGAVAVERRLERAAGHLVDGLLGESGGGSGKRLSGRIAELASPLGRARADDDGTVGFVGGVLRGNLRLLVGMVRANQPVRVFSRLSRALVGALGTAAYAASSASIWMLADGMTWLRLLAMTLLSVVVACVSLVLAHDLWERSPSPEARERVMLFNIATVSTVALGVASFYAVLFVFTVTGVATLIPPDLYDKNVGHAADLGDYLKLAWLVASVATFAGALGSMVESDVTVRNATYRNRDDARTEEEDEERASRE